MKILIVYGTTEGQTRKIARYMEEQLQSAGHSVVISDVSDEPPAPSGYDAVILGGSLHMMKHQTALAHYARLHAVELNIRPSAFFSVSLGIVSGEDSDIAEARTAAEQFVHEAAWSPERIELVAGAFRYTEYDYFKRFMMKMIAKRKGANSDTSRDQEYTDWGKVEAFCKAIVALAQKRITVG